MKWRRFVVNDYLVRVLPASFLTYGSPHSTIHPSIQIDE